jgi:hypothetical protein
MVRHYVDVIVGAHFGSTAHNSTKQNRIEPLVLSILRR